MTRLRVKVPGFVRKDRTRVKAHTRMVKDRGAPGRTPAEKRWFKPKGSLPGWHAADPPVKRHKALLRIIDKGAPYATVIRQLNALRNVSTSRTVDAAAKEDMGFLRWLKSWRKG